MKYIVAGTGAFAGGQSTVLAGLLSQETASIAYTGELLPTGTASYSGISLDATKRYLKNSGKDKTPALVESGQGKKFNGIDQCLSETWGKIGYTGLKSVFSIAFKLSAPLNSGYLINTGYESTNQGWSLKLNTTTSINFFTNLGTEAGLQIYFDGVVNPDVVVTFNNGLVKGYINGVLKAEKQFSITAVNFVSSERFSIGAYRALSSFASAIVGSVSLYGDVALTDAQIEALYKYPEKVKSYNGAIVPDIGYEANCKLFLPMCENSGSNVVNVAVARGSELVVNGGFDSDTSWTKSTGWDISGGLLNANVGNYNSSRQSFSFSVGKAYLCTYEVTSFSSGSVRLIFIGGTQVSGVARTAVGVYSEVLYAVSGNNEIGVQSVVTGFVGSVDNVSVKEITAYPLASYTTAMHTSAAKLSYGSQCTAWKRDSLGVLLGMSNGLSFDNTVSTKPINTNYIMPKTDFVIEYIVNPKAGTVMYIGAKDPTGTTRLTFGYSNGYVYTSIGSYVSGTIHFGALTEAVYHHLAVKYESATQTVTVYKDGIAYGSTAIVNFTGCTTPIYSYPDGAPIYALTDRVMGNFKIHKDTQYAKFNIAKAYAKALKTIAKLGA